MGETAENVAERYSVSREDQDAFARASQQKAGAGLSPESRTLVPVPIPQRKGDPILFDTDEHPRPGTTAEKLASLKPAFRGARSRRATPAGSTTARPRS